MNDGKNRQKIIVIILVVVAIVLGWVTVVVASVSNTVVGLLVVTSLVTAVFKLDVILESPNKIVALVTYSIVSYPAVVPFVIVSVTVASDGFGSVVVSYTGASVVLVLVRCIYQCC